MDAILVFDPQNNLISSKCDQQFLDYLSQFVAQNGFKTDVQDFNNNEVLRNLLSLLVTPFVVSQRYLLDVSQVEFDCFPNMKAVYHKNQEFFFLYIYENCQDPLLMQRKVNIIAQIIQFISGPIIDCFTSDPNLTELVFQMIDEWNTMSENMTYLLEAVERLFVGSDLMKICNNTLQHISNKIKLISKFSEENASHIYLFYGLKYITSISGENKTKISRGDMLLMILLSNTLHFESKSIGSREYSHSLSQRKQSFLESFSNLSLKEGLKRKKSKFNQYLVFLKSGEDQKMLVPYIYRKIPIEGQLFAIILSEVPTHLSSELILIINIINSLLNSPKEKSFCHLVIHLENCIKKVKNFILKNNLNREKSFASLLQNLIKLNNCQIFDKKFKNDKNLLNFQIEAQLLSLNHSIRYNYKTLVFDFFYNLIFRAQNLDSNLLNEIVFFSIKTFADYLGFFKVKNQRNMTLLGINVDIEGLIGFIYIDRTVNELIVAPIETNCELSQKDVNNNVLQMVYKAYNRLINGNLSHIWTDGVYQYSYVIWFEDTSGTPLRPRTTTFCLDSFPSIIGGNFIQGIINTCFSKETKIQERCQLMDDRKSSISCYPYELFSIYKCDSLLNETNAFKNTRKLSNKLWEIGVSTHF